MSFGIQVDEFTLTAGESKTFLFPNPFLYTGTMRIDNSQNIPPDSVLNVTNINYQDAQPVQITLNPQRYGWFFDNKPVERIDIKNMSSSVSMKIYFQYMVKNYVVPYSETNEFITTLIPVPATVSNQLYAGSNKRYKGSLSGATFFSSMPVGTQVAVRQVSASSTSSSALAQLTLPWSGNFESNYNIEPLNAINDTEIRIFSSDLVTNDLPASATTTNVSASSTQLVVDYLFDFNMQVSFGSYSLSGSNIVWAGQVLVYYFTDSSDPIPSASVNSITTTGTWTESPSSGTTNSSGLVPFTLTQALTSTTNLSGTVTADTTISGVSNKASASVPENQFDFTLAPTISSFLLNKNTATGNSVTSLNVSVNTTNTNDLIVVQVTTSVIESPTITSSPSLTWNLRSSFDAMYNSNGTSQTQIYYAKAGSPGSYSVTATGETLQLLTVYVLSANSVNTSSPFQTSSMKIGGENSTTSSVSLTPYNYPVLGFGLVAGVTAASINNMNVGTNISNINNSAVSSVSTAQSNDYTTTAYNTAQTFSYTIGSGYQVNMGADIVNITTWQINVKTTQGTPEVIPSQNVTLTITGSGSATFTSGGTSKTVATDENGNATFTIQNNNMTNTLTYSCTIANIVHSGTMTV